MRRPESVWCESEQSWIRLIWNGSHKTKSRMALYSSGKGNGSRDACAMDREQGATCECFRGVGYLDMNPPYSAVRAMALERGDQRDWHMKTA